MNMFAFLIRVGVSLSIAFAASLSSAVLFFDYTGYEYTIDRFMLVSVPTLAIGFLLFQVAPQIWNWLTKRNRTYIFVFSFFAILAALITVLPVGTSRVYLLGTFTYALVLLTFMFPAIPALERLSVKYQAKHYFFGTLLSFIFLYILIGFIFGTLDGRAYIIAVTLFWMIVSSIIGYYFIRHLAWSHKHGFLSNWLNLFMFSALPIFVIAFFIVLLQFPTMFTTGYFQIPNDFLDMFLSTAIVGGAWGIIVLEQIEKRGIYQAFRTTKVFAFIKENFFGICAGLTFFLINLFLARAINRPTYSFNSIIFEADAGPWLAILGYPDGFNVNRAVHPLTLITIRPFVRFFGLFLGDSWFLAPLIGIALTNAFAILMAWIFVKRATKNETFAFLFSILLGASASHILFGSITETYVFGMASLIFFLLLVQADEKRFSILVPAGLLVFGITVTNIAQSMIAMLLKKTHSFWSWFYYGVLVLTISIALTALVNVLFPGNQSSFWVPEDLLFEAQFSEPIYESKTEALITRSQIVGRTMFLYDVLAPTPYEAVRGRNTPGEIVNFKTYHYKDSIAAWYDGLANIPLIIWIILLITSLIFFIKNFRTDENTPLTTGILGGFAFNFFLHLNYGTELFLYTPYFTFLIIFFVALSLKPLVNKRWFETSLAIFVLMTFANNVNLVFTILSGLTRYFKGG